MKKLWFLALLLSVAIGFSACSSDDEEGPTGPGTYTVSGTITDAEGNPVANITVNMTGGATNSATTDAQGKYTFTNVAGGVNIEVTPTSPNMDFKPEKATINSLAADVTNSNFTAVGIYGKWVSEGANVAPLLVSLFKVTKITAEFQSNGSYTVTQEDSTGATLGLAGTFTLAKSGVGSIYTITLTQTSPTAITAEGIFEINSGVTPFTMQYEVVQTNPPAGVAPTPTGGFGSTNGGALGTINVQNYVRTP